MRLPSALLIVALTFLGSASFAGAQPVAHLDLDGTIQAVDCAGQQLTLQTGSGSTVLQSTLATVINADGQPQPLCALGNLVGARATVSVIPASGQLVIAELTVRSAPAAPQPAPYAPAPSPPSSQAPALIGTVLGTIVVAGLAYLLVQGANGAFYRYPYYGPYRQAYNQRSYQPYTGPLRPTLTYGPYRRCRDRTWSQWCY